MAQLDPRIILSGVVPQIKTAADARFDQLKMQQAEQATQLQKIQLQKAMETAPAQDDEAALMQEVLQETEGDWTKVPTALLKRGHTKQALDFLKAADEHLEAQKKLQPPTPPPTRPVAVPTVDEQGNPVTKFVEPVAGESYPTAPKPPTADSLPAIAKEYEYAKANGYKGSFEQYQNEDANRKKPVTRITTGGASDGGVGTLSPAGLELAATSYRLLRALPARDSKQNGAIISKAAEQAALLGNSPVATIQKQAAYKADSAALTKMTNMAAAAESFENKALAQADIVSELSKKVSRTQFPILNTAILAGKKDILGDADTQKLFNALTTFTAEYAKIMEGSTGAVAASSDAARKAAASLISAKLSKGTLDSTLELMKKEMRYSIQGYDATIQHINERMGAVAGTPAPAQAAPPAAAAKRVYYDAKGNPISGR